MYVFCFGSFGVFFCLFSSLFIHVLYHSFFTSISIRVCVCLCEFLVRTLHFYQHVIRHAVFTYACSNQMVNSQSVRTTLCLFWLYHFSFERIIFELNSMWIWCYIVCLFGFRTMHAHHTPLSISSMAHWRWSGQLNITWTRNDTDANERTNETNEKITIIIK